MEIGKIMEKSQKMKIELYLSQETEKAFCVWDKKTFGRRGREVKWVPKSMVNKGIMISDNTYIFDVPAWLAKRESLIDDQT